MTLYRSSGLVSGLERMVDQCRRLLYENAQGTLHNMAMRIGEMASPEKKRGIESHLQELTSRFGLYRELTESSMEWESSAFIAFVRHIGRHFRLLDAVLHKYAIARTTPLDNDLVDAWEQFKEEYNQLRARWKTYLDRVPQADRLHVQLMSECARSLPQPTTTT